MSRARVESDWTGNFTVRGEYIQTDWDYPATAESLGWSLMRVQKRAGETVVLKRRPPERNGVCAHRSTDGTVDCRDCGVTASEFIGAAGEWLHEVAS